MGRPDGYLAIAAFRYRLIAEALEVSDPVAVGALLTASAAQTHTDPHGQPHQCSARTLWRYLCQDVS